MPTNRVRIDRGRRDALTLAQRCHLQCGCYFFDFPAGELDHFADEQHRRRAWQLHRGQILEDWDRPGRRPDALWEYEVKGGWEAIAETEEAAVHKLLKRGRVKHCRLNGSLRIADEVEQIEGEWRDAVRIAILHTSDGEAARSYAADFNGVPRAFFDAHEAGARAEIERERAAWRKQFPGLTI
jgi:hypothetical protein